MIIDIVIYEKYDSRKLYVLLDTGVQRNFLSQIVAQEEDFQANQSSVRTMAIDRHIIPIYGYHEIEIDIQDFRKEIRISKRKFIVMNMKRYNIILDWPWIHDMDPDCYGQDSIGYYQEKIDIKEMNIKKFQLIEKTGKMIFAIFVMLMTELQDICMILNSTEVIDIQLLKKYENYINVFSEIEISKFLEFIYVEYMIPVKENKKISFGLIYRLSENELGILYKYLASSMIKR